MPQIRSCTKYICLLTLPAIIVGGMAFAQTPDWKPQKKVTTTAKPAAPKPTAAKTTNTNKTTTTKPTATKPAATAKPPIKKETKPNNNVPDFKPGANKVSVPTNNYSVEEYTKVVIDQSQELMNVDMGLADEIRENGPFLAYSKHLSKEGILYDADGGTPEGQNSAELRFKGFPNTLTLIRIPEKAMAYSNGGSTWGEYRVFRGASLISNGRYLAVWRKEPEGWKIVSELAAGKDTPAQTLPSKPTSDKTTPNNANGNNAKTKNPNQLYDALGRPIGQ